MKYSRYCRSLLSTPATAVHRYAVGHRSGADISMVDLEDSIPPARKEEARRRAEGFFTLPTAATTRCAVRINAISGPDGLRDLLALRQYAVKPPLVLIPMVESRRDVEIVEHVLGPECPHTEFIAVVETPRGLENASSIAASSPGLRALVFGSADYAFATGARLTWEALAHARGVLVNSARAAGIEVMDAPLFAVHDDGALRREAALAKDMGFSGKIAVHPRQVPLINEAFSPDAATLGRARRIVAAGRENGRDITVVDGMMIGAPFFEAARRLVEEFGDGPEVPAGPPRGAEDGTPDASGPPPRPAVPMPPAARPSPAQAPVPAPIPVPALPRPYPHAPRSTTATQEREQ
ncbi:HpcH/HpaI aldolase/citrate lyase family protein [Streptomyces sp. URMC 126]|uniref:HpcH/HpaI aldolase/citrate lyase family protein n=1 Tax=Streptomyces sp. URMC 126 TaxID=3423401 RepID=UPI003F1CF4DF